LKILLTTHQFLPDFAAGTEILTLETAKELRRLGHEVVVFTGFPGDKELSDAERFDSYSYYDIPVERFHHAYVPMGGHSNVIEAEYNNLFFAAHFRKFLQNWKPDLVHFFHLQRLSASAIDVCCELGIPMVLTPTDFWLVCFTNQLRMPDNLLCGGPACRGINCLRHVVAISQPLAVRTLVAKLPDWLVRAAVRVCSVRLLANITAASQVRALADRPEFMKQRMNMLSRVMVPTLLMGEILKENGLRSEKIIFSPFGINLKPFQRHARKEAKEPLRVGYIGTLSEHKGVHLLVKALRSLPDHEPIEVKIYGKTVDYPEYAEELRRIAGDDPRITFCGTFPNDRIGDIFAGLDVLVVPSIWYENTPLVIYSAHAAGCPVIAANLGGMAEVVRHGENGLLFEPGEVAGLAEALECLCRDRGVLRRLTRNVRPPRSIENYVEELLHVYEDVIAEIHGRTALDG